MAALGVGSARPWSRGKHQLDGFADVLTSPRAPLGSGDAAETAAPPFPLEAGAAAEPLRKIVMSDMWSGQYCRTVCLSKSKTSRQLRFDVVTIRWKTTVRS